MTSSTAIFLTLSSSSFYVLVRLTQHVMSAQDAHSFLSMTFGSALIHVKRSFDKFMQLQLQSIKDARVPKRSKCGLLPYVENFEEFAKTAEAIFRKTERRNDLDKWYLKLVDAIFECIPSHAQDHPKTPQQVIKMENFHHMHSLLKQLKVGSLEEQKKLAKLRYQDALRAYVTKYFGKPLEKLNVRNFYVFFAKLLSVCLSEDFPNFKDLSQGLILKNSLGGFFQNLLLSLEQWF